MRHDGAATQMATMARPAFTITAAEAERDLVEVAALMREYAAGLDVDLAYQDFEQELAGLPGAYAPPSGALLLARDSSGRAVGCVALRALLSLPACCEMKRLYVAPHGRGTGLGRALMRAVIALAHERGYREIRLDTLPTMTTAMSMYRQAGFRQVAPYYASAPEGTLFMALELA
jgi:ribosomal protein S18 acetylase RimI-like enzyme